MVSYFGIGAGAQTALQFKGRCAYYYKMKTRNAAASLAPFLFLVIFTSCGSQSNTNTQANSAANSNASNSTTAKTNVEELGMLINVPYESEEAFWKDDAAHKKLVAVLRFPQPEANRLIADAEKVRPAQQTTIPSEPWFPPELIAQGDLSGDDTLNGKSYAANAFFQDPYNDGRITRIEDTDYFVLELSSK